MSSVCTVYKRRDDKSFEINLLFIQYMKGYFQKTTNSQQHNIDT